MIQLQEDQGLLQELCLRKGKKNISNIGPSHPLFIKKIDRLLQLIWLFAFIFIPLFEYSQKKKNSKQKAGS